MDFSKFSDQSLLAIRSGDYSKLSDDELKLLKQETTGVAVPEKPKAAEQMYGEPGLQDVSLTPFTQQDFNQEGQTAATGLARSGMNPYASAAIGTGIQMAPDIAMAAQGMSGLGAAREAAQAGDLGIAGRVISGPGRAEAGQAIGAAEKGVGINTDLVPTLKDASTSLGAWRANPQQYLNALAERLNSGIEMSPQDLSLHHKMITDLLSQEPGKLAQVFGNAKSNLGTNGVSTAAKLDRMLVQKLNQVATGRGDAAANYAAAKLRGNIYKGAAGTGAALVGKNAILDAFQRLTGGR